MENGWTHTDRPPVGFAFCSCGLRCQTGVEVLKFFGYNKILYVIKKEYIFGKNVPIDQ